MARKRMIDPDFWRDEKVGKLKPVERLLFIGMWNFADDEGYGRAGASLLKSDIFPYDEGIKPGTIKTALARLAQLGMIILYEAEGQCYYFIRNFLRHQKINRPTPSLFPKPNSEDVNAHKVINEHSLNTHGALTANIIEDNIREKNISKENISCQDSGAESDSDNLDAEKPDKPKRKKTGTLTAKQQAGFDRFWAAYPKKESPGAAEKAWAKIDPDEEETNRIIGAVLLSKNRDYRFKSRQFTPLPATWLNAKGYASEYDDAGQAEAVQVESYRVEGM